MYKRALRKNGSLKNIRNLRRNGLELYKVWGLRKSGESTKTYQAS
jgi:hypothetical protein